MESFVKMLAREKVMQQVFLELNNFVDLKPSLQVISTYIKAMFECDSIAIRLKSNDFDGFPYYTYDGFSDEFIEHEDDICVRDELGNVCYDDKGCILQCMCGAVINGTTDVDYPFFTNGGSFWSSDLGSLVGTISQIEKEKFKIREYCSLCGYNSLALIPIRENGSIIGLLQLNDFEKDKFTLSSVNYLEMIGLQIGVSIKNRLKYTMLMEQYNTLLSKTHYCSQ